MALGFWTVAGVTALLCGALVTWLPFAVPVATLVAVWPLARRFRGAGWVLDWLPLPLVILTYEMLRAVVPVCFDGTIDGWLRDVDRTVFGDDLGVLLLGIVSEPLTAVMSLFYALYYVMPVSAAVWWYRRNRTAFRELMVGEVGSLFIGHLGYLFLPAVGPYAFIPETAFQGTLPGDFTGAAIQSLIEFQGSVFPRDAFPSLHTANAVTILLVGWRHGRSVVAVYALPVAGLAAATVYLRFHYAVDVAAGIALAVAWQAFVPRLLAREAGSAEYNPLGPESEPTGGPE